ncbi:LacI family DNA-binding transcriptional regulator [Xylanimonas allomyrinae]|uniref:LacI family DNA-binding transcriptional regulator n=1 Tax=Xylanimonas allomyrinae TaxID=2509459 RepID=UPI0013A60892|nr:LacI family DNA-binding transcriptional regulator [Xylanimonas allomyrinae]
MSVATASNALSGTRPVAESTRQRVFRVAEELDYHPNLIARGLRRQETRTIALLVADIANPYYPAVARAIHDRVGSHGYVSFIGNTDGDPLTEVRVLEEMRSRSVDGVIMSTMSLSAERIRSVLGPTIPLVLLTGEPPEGPDGSPRRILADEVSTDDETGVREAVAHLLDRGRRAIGFLSGPDATVPGSNRLAHFRAAMADHGAPVVEAWVEHATGYTIDGGFAAAERLFARADRPAAVMCANDQIAIGAIEAARDADLAIPEDIAIVGFDDIPTSKLLSPRLTTVINPATLIGYACADALIRRIEHPARPFDRYALATHLVVRGSA